MMRTLLLAIGLVAVAGALALRIHDAPYIRYMHGDRTGAIEGLTRKAQAGDGFAGYLLAESTGGEARKTEELLLGAAVRGEGRAAAPFLRLAAQNGHCATAVPLLEMLARARDARAALALGDLARDGTCGARDPIRAAGYYSGAARLEPVFEHRLESLPPLAGDTPIRQLPEKYDVTREDARARFMAEAPGLLAAR